MKNFFISFSVRFFLLLQGNKANSGEFHVIEKYLQILVSWRCEIHIKSTSTSTPLNLQSSSLATIILVIIIIDDTVMNHYNHSQSLHTSNKSTPIHSKFSNARSENNILRISIAHKSLSSLFFLWNRESIRTQQPFICAHDKSR